MVSITAFVAELLGSVVDLVVIFITEVALRDPLAFAAFASGGAFIAVSVGFFGYLVLGALGELLGASGVGTPGRTPPPRE